MVSKHVGCMRREWRGAHEMATTAAVSARGGTLERSLENDEILPSSPSGSDTR